MNSATKPESTKSLFKGIDKPQCVTHTLQEHTDTTASFLAKAAASCTGTRP